MTGSGETVARPQWALAVAGGAHVTGGCDQADAWERFVQSLPFADVRTQNLRPLDQGRLRWVVEGFQSRAEDLDDRRRFAALLTVVPPEAARCFAVAIGWEQRVPKGAVRRLEHYLAAVDEVAPKVSLRAGVGWAVVAGHAVGVEYDILTMSLFEDAARAKPIVAPWAAAGLAEMGWVYAAAGYTVAEVQQGLDAGSLTEADARALAALRGVPLPA